MTQVLATCSWARSLVASPRSERKTSWEGDPRLRQSNANQQESDFVFESSCATGHHVTHLWRTQHYHPMMLHRSTRRRSFSVFCQAYCRRKTHLSSWHHRSVAGSPWKVRKLGRSGASGHGGKRAKMGKSGKNWKIGKGCPDRPSFRTFHGEPASEGSPC